MKGRIAGLKKKNKGYWLAIKVTRRGKHGEPVAGHVVAKAKSHHGLHRVLKDPNVYETYAGKVPTKAIVF